MTLVRWQPFHNITTLQREIDRLFGNLAEGDDRWLSTAFTPAAEDDKNKTVKVLVAA